MKTQGNIIPPEMTHPTAIASNDSETDEIPAKELKIIANMCKKK